MCSNATPMCSKAFLLCKQYLNTVSDRSDSRTTLNPVSCAEGHGDLHFSYSLAPVTPEHNASTHSSARMAENCVNESQWALGQCFVVVLIFVYYCVRKYYKNTSFGPFNLN